MRPFPYRIALIALALGLISAPIVLPLLASFGGAASAQSLPFTPTPEPTSPASATAAATATRSPAASATAAATATPTRTPDPEVPILGSPTMATPVSGGGSTPAPASTSAPTATPAPGTVKDQCEENDSLVQPCAIPAGTDITNLTFVDDATDVFSVFLKAGRSYTIRAAAGSSGIDPVLTVYLASAPEAVLAENDDAAANALDASVTLNVAGDGWYLLKVDNKASGSMFGRTYSLQIRADAPQQGTTNATPQPTADANIPIQATVGDHYENNWSPDTGGVLAWGVPYDLSLVCPEVGGCASGDHDFFWVPVKSGVPLVAVSYDLGPGADPAMTLYRPQPNYTDPATGMVGWQAWLSNDDVVPGLTLRSQFLAIPDWGGYALLVVASSERRDPPPLPPAAGPAGRYRLIVGPPALASVAQVLSAQTDIPPPPTATPEPPPPPTSQPLNAPVQVQPTAASDAREVIRQESATGMAVVVSATTLYAAAPPTESDALASYPEGAQVRLLGQSYAGWVKVQPVDSVTPGWMFAPNLRPLDGGAADAPPAASATSGTAGGTTGGSTGGTTGGSTGGTTGGGTTGGSTGGTTGGTTGGSSTITVLPPLPIPAAPVVQPEARTVSVEVCTAKSQPPRACDTPLRNLRVEVLLASTRAVITGDTTKRDGIVTLSVSVRPNTALLLRIPALGIETLLGERETTVPIRIPGKEGNL